MSNILKKMYAIFEEEREKVGSEALADALVNKKPRC